LYYNHAFNIPTYCSPQGSITKGSNQINTA
jgi:hypothetical protein